MVTKGVIVTSKREREEAVDFEANYKHSSVHQ